jgi:hypothetical protein
VSLERYLITLASALAPGEQTHLWGPNKAGWPALLMGTRWPGFGSRFRWYLTDRSLERIAARAGFSVSRWSTSSNLRYPDRPGFRGSFRDRLFACAAWMGYGDRFEAILSRQPVSTAELDGSGSPC